MGADDKVKEGGPRNWHGGEKQAKKKGEQVKGKTGVAGPEKGMRRPSEGGCRRKKRGGKAKGMGGGESQKKGGLKQAKSMAGVRSWQRWGGLLYVCEDLFSRISPFLFFYLPRKMGSIQLHGNVNCVLGIQASSHRSTSDKVSKWLYSQKMLRNDA